MVQQTLQLEPKRRGEVSRVSKKSETDKHEQTNMHPGSNRWKSTERLLRSIDNTTQLHRILLGFHKEHVHQEHDRREVRRLQDICDRRYQISS